MEEIMNFLKNTIREICSSDEEMALEESVKIIDIPLDSVQYVMLLVRIEEKYSFEFDDEYLVGDKFTLGDICQYISDKCENACNKR